MKLGSKQATKNVSILLSVFVVLSNVVLVHSAETNLWTDRKKTQLASLPLPSPLLPSSSILNQLPVSRSSSLKSALPPRIANSLSRDSVKKYSPLFQALPAAYGSITNINRPSVWDSKKTVIFIQDVHQQLEAQENIGKTIDSLIHQNQVGLVALEGAFENIDLARFRIPKYQGAVKRVADYLLKENRISGAIHTAFTNTEKVPPIIGVDSQDHYEANVQAVRDSEPLKESMRQYLSENERQLNEKKRQTLNPALLAFDHRVEAYRKEALNLGSYVQVLKKQGVHMSLSVESFLEALEMESALNFSKVESERSQLLNRLLKELSQDEIADLTERSVAYRLGDIRHTDFYDYLITLCQRKGVDLARYGEMKAYIQYLLLSDGLDVERILADVKEMENAAYAALIQTPAEQALVAESKTLYLQGKLVDFSLTSEEWGEYKMIPPPGSRERGRQRRLAEELSFFEKFYEEALHRDRAMVNNLLNAMEEQRASVAVLVAGGFHSSGINKLMEAAGVTTLTFTPKITKLTDETGVGYLSVFTQEKTSLDRLFEGEKLFVAPKQKPALPIIILLVAATAAYLSGMEADYLQTLVDLGGAVAGQLSHTIHLGAQQAVVSLSEGLSLRNLVLSFEGSSAISGVELKTASFTPVVLMTLAIAAGEKFLAFVKSASTRKKSRSSHPRKPILEWLERRFAMTGFFPGSSTPSQEPPAIFSVAEGESGVQQATSPNGQVEAYFRTSDNSVILLDQSGFRPPVVIPLGVDSSEVTLHGIQFTDNSLNVVIHFERGSILAPSPQVWVVDIYGVRKTTVGLFDLGTKVEIVDIANDHVVLSYSSSSIDDPSNEVNHVDAFFFHVLDGSRLSQASKLLEVSPDGQSMVLLTKTFDPNDSRYIIEALTMVNTTTGQSSTVDINVIPLNEIFSIKDHVSDVQFGEDGSLLVTSQFYAPRYHGLTDEYHKVIVISGDEVIFDSSWSQNGAIQISQSTEISFSNNYVQYVAQPVIQTGESSLGWGEEEVFGFTLPQPPGSHLDTNRDGSVTPIDVLGIVNYLNSDASNYVGPFFWKDPTKDGYVTPQDALVIINYLNSSSSGEAEGEQSLSSYQTAVDQLMEEWTPGEGEASAAVLSAGPESLEYFLKKLRGEYFNPRRVLIGEATPSRIAPPSSLFHHLWTLFFLPTLRETYAAQIIPLFEIPVILFVGYWFHPSTGMLMAMAMMTAHVVSAPHSKDPVLARSDFAAMQHSLFLVLPALVGFVSGIEYAGLVGVLMMAGQAVTDQRFFVRSRSSIAHLDSTAVDIAKAYQDPSRLQSLIQVGPQKVADLGRSRPVSHEGEARNYLALSASQKNYVARKVEKILADQAGRSAGSLSHNRFLTLQSLGQSFQSLKEIVGDGNLAMDINVRSKEDIGAAVQTILKALGEISIGSQIAIPAPADELVMRELRQALLNQQASRVQFIPSPEGGYFSDQGNRKQVFNMDAYLRALDGKGFTNTIIATQGEYDVTPAVLKEFERKGVVRSLVLFMEWLNGILGYVMNGHIRMEDIDKLARPATHA
ncbi:MAG: hypothetical protein KCHDKBKB_02952 [Elusimicrobia bacterium]|nr:hypothetical protein [Elusimicrobiota bacterium]